MGSKPKLSCGCWLRRAAFTARCGLLPGKCRGRIQSRLEKKKKKRKLFPWRVLWQTLQQDHQSRWCERTTAKSPASAGLRRGAGGVGRTLTKTEQAWVEGEELQPSSCPGANAASSHGIWCTLCAALIVNLFHKNLKILAVLQANLRKAVKIRASAVKCPIAPILKAVFNLSHFDF